MMIHKINLKSVRCSRSMTRSIVVGESQLELIICLTISFYFVFSERAFTDLVKVIQSVVRRVRRRTYGCKVNFCFIFLYFHVEYIFLRRVRMMMGRFLHFFSEQFSQYYCCDVYSDGFSAFCRQEEKPRLCNHSLFFAYFN